MATTKKATEPKPVEEATPVIEEPIAPKAEKIVTIRIPRETGDQEDKVVWVNERRFLIKRGVPVDVPESVALILEQEERALQTIYDFESKVQR